MIRQPDGLVCWKCGASLVGLPFPLGRIAVCPSCEAELHVCKLCEYYDTAVADQCREPVAEQVKEKDRANFCDYFKAMPNAYIAQNKNDAASQARAQLDALFGNSTISSEKPSDETNSEEIARAKLEDLFKK